METTYLAHHGVKGMHWGVRRYQNADGSLTSAGKNKFEKTKAKYNKKATINGGLSKSVTNSQTRKLYENKAKRYSKIASAKTLDEQREAIRKDRNQRIFDKTIKIAAGLAVDQVLTGGQHRKNTIRMVKTGSKIVTNYAKIKTSKFVKKYGTIGNYARGVSYVN